MLDNIFNTNENIVYHATCPHCGAYMGQLKNLSSEICMACEKVSEWTKPSIENLFSIINPTEQIAKLLNQYESYYDFIVKDRKHDEGVTKDVYVGNKYLELLSTLSPAEQHSYATAILNSDGASPFKFSKKSVWPVYLLINELPVKARFKNIIVIGLWYGCNKPDMNILLSPIVDLLNDLN